MTRPVHELYDQHAEDFDSDTDFEALPDELLALLESFVAGIPGQLVLDAGCGPGRDVEYFHNLGLDPIGIDLARSMLERARDHRPGQYLQMDVRDLGFRDDRFDGIWCPATIFFLPTEEMATTLREFSRVLGSDGVARIGFKLGEGPVEVEKWDETTMEYHVSKERARQLLREAGFWIESVSVTAVSPARTFANFYCRQAAFEG